MKLRRSQVPSGWTTRREIEPLSAWMKAKGRLEVAIAQTLDEVVPLSVDEVYELGCEVEESDPEHAEASYRQVLTET